MLDKLDSLAFGDVNGMKDLQNSNRALPYSYIDQSSVLSYGTTLILINKQFDYILMTKGKIAYMYKTLLQKNSTETEHYCTDQGSSIAKVTVLTSVGMRTCLAI